jgi:NitT/TauT family transport system permease protein/taurine transport system permease protein
MTGIDRLALRRTIEGLLPFALLLAAWALAPQFVEYPAYMLPTMSRVAGAFVTGITEGQLLVYTGESLLRLLAGFVIGNAIALPLGIAIALNRNVADLLLPLLAFLQSIAGIAWIPLAIIWFGIGNGATIFVVANIIFFSVIYNAVTGVQAIPIALRRAVLSHGGRGMQVLTELIVPGALVQIILGLRTSVAMGWRALVAGEMLAGTGGLGYMTLEAVQWYRTEIVILGMLLIGVLWLVIDRLIFVPLERSTVLKWGVMQR